MVTVCGRGPVRGRARGRARARGRHADEEEEEQEEEEAPQQAMSPLQEEASHLLTLLAASLPAGRVNLSKRRQMDPLL